MCIYLNSELVEGIKKEEKSKNEGSTKLSLQSINKLWLWSNPTFQLQAASSSLSLDGGLVLVLSLLSQGRPRQSARQGRVEY